MPHFRLLQAALGRGRKNSGGWIMTIDKPEIPEFAYYDSYERFARRVRGERRYATDSASQAFIATVLATAPARLWTLKKGEIFYRAQLGISKYKSVDSDDGIEYVPTQILADAFVGAGYEAIAYRSNFGNPDYNIVLFDINDAHILNCAPYTVRKLEIEFDQIGNTWFMNN
jgi:hypothetical protein